MEKTKANSSGFLVKFKYDLTCVKLSGISFWHLVNQLTFSFPASPSLHSSFLPSFLLPSEVSFRLG